MCVYKFLHPGFCKEGTDKSGIQATKLTAVGIDSPSTSARYARSNILWRGSLPTEDITVNLEKHLYRGLKIKGLPPCYPTMAVAAHIMIGIPSLKS